MDPAVLEAQVTVDAQREPVNSSYNSSNNSTYHSSYNSSHNSSRASTSSYGDTERTKTRKDVRADSGFNKAMSVQQAALFSLSPSQFNLLLNYVDTLRRQRQTLQKQMECAFCKNNGHPEVWYTTHPLKDSLGRVRCPVLRTYSCRRCGATGDHAHTIRYCPVN